MEKDEKYTFLLDLINCISPLFSWIYDNQLKLIFNNCENKDFWDNFFTLNGCNEKMLTYARYNSKPLILSDKVGMVWLVVPEHESARLIQIHVLGPAFNLEYSQSAIDKQLSNLPLSAMIKQNLRQHISELPIVSMNNCLLFIIMLYFYVTGIKLSVSDVVYQAEKQEDPEGVSVSSSSNKLSRQWGAAEALFQLIEEGNVHYKTIFKNNFILDFGTYPQNPNDAPIRLLKNKVFLFIARCNNAAMNGGLPIPIGMDLESYYVNKVENCSTVSAINEVSREMYDDYIHRVHKYRINPQISTTILLCCDYIDQHIEDKIQLKDLSDHVGYAEYYLSRKFKKETGMTINDYICKAKIERSKVLLLSTDMSIQEISDSLNYSSRNYFTKCFTTLTGITPGEYRKKQEQHR